MQLLFAIEVMKPKRTTGIDKEVLRAWKESTPEQKMEWLAAAQEFARAPRRIRPAHPEKDRH